VFGTIPSPVVAAEIAVTTNQDLVVKLPSNVATIVVGNPLLVDVHLTSRGNIVVTGKSYGETNIILLDGAGTVLMQPTVLVRSQNNNEVVYRGAKKNDDAPTEPAAPNPSILRVDGGR
jgi:Flp pilus assembly secretin CpaC